MMSSPIRASPWQQVLLSILLLVAQAPAYNCQSASECIPYRLHGTSLHCSGVFSECDYVLPGSNLSSVEMAENQLGEVIRRAESGVTQDCFNGFVSLYCHQVYVPCQETPGGQYMTLVQPLCHSDCQAVIETSCSVTQWSYLENIVKTARDNGTTQTPPLRSTCTDLPSNLGNCTTISGAETDCAPDDSDGLSTGELIAIVVTGIFLVLTLLVSMVLIMGCYFKLTRRRNKEEGTDSEAPGSLERNKVDDRKGDYNRNTLMLRPTVARDAMLGATAPAPRTGTMLKRIGTKDFRKLTPKQRIQSLEFPHANICILKDLGQINFGGTFLGEAMGLKENEVSTTVYIKSLRERASSKLRQQYIAEMTWASGFSHPNIISLLGVCNKEMPRYMIYEYMDFGSLKDFLQSIDSAWFDLEQVLSETVSTHASSNAPIIGIDDLTSISCQLADGMDYLAKKNFVHRDIAARNCQIGHGLRVKIANFGFTYDLHSEDYCHLSTIKSATPLPLRWLAPETLQNGTFSPYTDVWSFGVLLWEVFTFGARPYADLTNAEVVLQVLNHNLLPRPDKCPETVYKVMEKSWSKVPSERPWFSSVKQELNSVLDGFGLMDVKRFGRTSSNPRLLDQLS